MKILITGGIKSGKSSLALRLALERFGEPRCFLATAEAPDEEMSRRIENHRRERGGRFVTVEEPIRIDRVLADNVLLDCVTLWMNNLFFKGLEDEWEGILSRFSSRPAGNTIFVTNEVGWGNIPLDAATRRYNEYLGRANTFLAARCDEVYCVMAGIPLRLK